MESRKRFLYGGLGGLIAVVVWLVVSDHQAIGQSIQDALTREDRLFYCLGCLGRLVGLFLSGGIAVAIFNPDETEIRKMVQLGMAGPALLAGFVGVQGLPVDKPKAQVEEQQILKQPKQGACFSFCAVAHAQTSPSIPVTEYPELQSSPVQQFFRGLKAAGPPEKRFYVIVGSEKSRQEAIARAEKYARQFPQFSYVVYEPYKSEYYGIAIGSSSSFDQANALKNKAISSGFPDGAYLKAVP
jgi:hypothetical protein